MRIFHQTNRRNPISIFMVIPIFAVLAIFGGTVSAKTVSTPEANEIILVQKGAPPAEFYTNTYNLMQTQGYQITASPNTLKFNVRNIMKNQPLAFSARKQVNSHLALWITYNFKPIPGGGELLASVKYADNVNAPFSQWKSANWTNPQSKKAFLTGLNLIQHTEYDDLYYAVEVNEPTAPMA